MVTGQTLPRALPWAVELHPFGVPQAEGLPFFSPAHRAGTGVWTFFFHFPLDSLCAA